VPRPSSPPIGLLLARTAKAVSRAFDDALAAAGGSLPVWLVLLAVKTREHANQRELAGSVGIEGATLTHHLNAMEERGLISRERDPANRRVQLVSLTADGEELFHRLAAAARAHDQRLRRGFAGPELEHMAQLLTRMAANVQDGAR
jgi:MarR family transcriptional regulator for hemolysin